jgi:hypothetical protein
VPTALPGIQGLLVTFETTQNPAAPNMGQQVYLGELLPASSSGRGVIKLVLYINSLAASQLGTPGAPMYNRAAPVGTASILTDLGSGIS